MSVSINPSERWWNGDEKEPDTDEVLRELQRLYQVGSDELVQGLDARQVALTAARAQLVIGRLRAVIEAPKGERVG